MALATMFMPAAEVAGAGAFGGIAGVDWLNAGSAVLGKALGPSSAGPSRADSGGQNWLSFDNSGWTVATGGSAAEAVRGFELPAWAWLAVGFGVLLWVRRKKS